VTLVGGLPGITNRRLLTRAVELTTAAAGDAGAALAGVDTDVVLLDGRVPMAQLESALTALAGRDDASRPVVLLVHDRKRARLSRRVQSLVDDVVSGALGERQVLARIEAGLRVRGWLSELARKNAELQTLYGRLEIMAGRMAEELRLASNVQRSLLPAPLQHARLEVAREFIPFREIGGDFYDFVPLGPHRMAVAIGDVMGKGVPAALLAASLKASIRAQVEAGDLCPAVLVTKVNRLFWDVVPNGLFASFFFAVFDLQTCRLDYVNAGHHYPFRVDADGRLRDLAEGGTVLGLSEDSRYAQETVAVRPGDLFVFYSDGITDRTDPGGEIYGVERLKEAAVRSRADAARISLYSLLGEVQGWSAGGPADDDMTLIVARAR
jgi:sigma-B regulation protein RsbU (phosphoserine phosphatase)